MKTVDARGLSCPEPVLRAREALKSKEKEYIILVDNMTSRENVTRFARSQGYNTTVTEKDGEYTLALRK